VIRVHFHILFLKSEFFMILLTPSMKKLQHNVRTQKHSVKVAEIIKIPANLLPAALRLLLFYIYSEQTIGKIGTVLSQIKSKDVLIQLLELSFCTGLLFLHDVCDSVLAELCSRDRMTMHDLVQDDKLDLLSKWKMGHRGSVEKMASSFFPDNKSAFATTQFSRLFDSLDFSAFAPKIRSLIFSSSQAHAKYLSSKKTALVQIQPANRQPHSSTTFVTVSLIEFSDLAPHQSL
jgi:hypothetical protein